MAEILSQRQRVFLEANHSAIMATVDDRGRPHAVPVLCALVDTDPEQTLNLLEIARACSSGSR